MHDNLNQRIDAILKSTQGSHRAKPKADLLAKIEYQLYNQKASIIPIRQLRLIAAAAVFLLFINVIAISIYLSQEVPSTEYASSFIMDYKLYE